MSVREYSLQPNTDLQGGRYRIIRSLGCGGFGITYLAEQVMADRKVCIKEFFPKEYYNRNEDSQSISIGSQGSAEIMERYKEKFVKEAKTIAKLDHPNIIHIFDVFEENNTCYYVMEYIEGESLSDIVKRGGALAEADAVRYIREVASALGYIHDRKINHLDVKPGNIMVRREDNRAILIDFGLSKHYDSAGDQTSSTPVGISHGFAPIEQYKQGGVGSFSPTTDIYALGATLYYLATGNVPPSATDVGEDGLPALPTHLSSSLCKTIEKSMSYWRKDRPQTVKEFVAMLDGCDAPKVAVTESTVVSVAATDDEKTKIVAPQPKAEQPKPEPKPSKPEHPKSKKSRWWLWLFGLLLIVGGAFFIWNANKTDKETNRDKETNGPYSVGDYYNENGKEGVVFEVSDGGRHGKIVSLDETEATWDSAKEWCQNKGDGWYLPSKDELLTIHGCKSEINNTLNKNNAEGISKGRYWSSTEHREHFAWYVVMGYGDTGNSDKYSSRYVRAVSAF